MARRKQEPVVERELTEEERLEAEQAEAARRGADDWEAPPGKAKALLPTLRRLLGLLAPFKALLALVFLVGSAGIVLNVIAPRVLAEGTNLIVQGLVQQTLGAQGVPAGTSQADVVALLRQQGQDDVANIIANMDGFTVGAGIDFGALSQVLMLVLALYVVASLFQWVQGYFVNRVVQRTVAGLRAAVEDKVHRLPLRYYDSMQRGELLSRVTNDLDNVGQSMSQTLSQIVTGVLTIVGVLVMMLTINVWLALIALISVPLTGIILGLVMGRAQGLFAEQWKRTGRLNGLVEESFTGHALVKVFGKEREVRDRFQAENEAVFQASFKAQFLSGLVFPLMTFVGNVGYVLVAVAGGLFVANGSIRVGDVQAFIQYSQQFSQNLGQLGQTFTMVQSGAASAERVFELLDAEDEESDADGGTIEATSGAVAFEHVAFAYDPEQPLIGDLSLTVAPGQTVAIVGPTGAGKTTLVNLLMRFYEIDGGRITLDGVDTRTLTRDALRAQTGMVLQDTWLFGGTIRDNIAYGRPEATEDEILQAARATFVDRFVQSLPEGYDTVLDEEASNLSAGEKQLVTIARAFLAQPSVLILDEATSSVDTRTELLLQQAMAALRQDRTSFVIAHRLSTIRDADLILVMEHGDIVEQGTHDELLARRGAYRRLYEAQFQQAAVDLEETEGVHAPTGSVATQPHT
ncbi:ABC transporter ATP-binding protein [Agrococcus sp. SGAir0287]|uniref:ABC transporter ATP-binding protein n=1 Tax=Agrococcus sp. SGAir0287 TaxID=2070347 RepID=UPI0010CCE82B|nr:ABC transporter ATP-binding protein [Agrococcus sp. SGAir0287]QCR18645.1 multidrug ABC transporter ATP-binding protein [Agrococcus sp. SGAir0287]